MSVVCKERNPFVVCGPVVSAASYGSLAVRADCLALAVDASGTIAGVAPASDAEKLRAQLGLPDAKIAQLPEGHVLCPGFVDVHIHAPQYAYAGTATDRPLMEWLEAHTFPSEAQLVDTDTARRRYDAVVRGTLRHGTTTALYFATVHTEPCKVLCEAVAELGQRALVGKVCQDRNSPEGVLETTAGSLADTEAFIQYVQRSDQGRRGMLFPAITPRFVPTCSPELLDGLGRLADAHGVRIQSHISESDDQVAFVESLHPGTRDTELFHSAGLLNHRAVMAHGTKLTESELRTLASAGSAIAHCPLSNFFFGNGLLSVEQCKALGVKIGLATDVAGGYSPSMLSAIRSAVITHKVLKMPGTNHPHNGPTSDFDFKHAFWLATMGSAEALGLQGRIGSLEVGKQFDALQVDLSGRSSSYDVFEADTLMAGLEKWINLGDDREIHRVWIDGLVVRDTP